VGKPEGKRLLGLPWCRRKDNIKKIFWKLNGDHGLIDLAQDRDR